MIAPAHHPCPILETSLRKYNLTTLTIILIIILLSIRMIATAHHPGPILETSRRKYNLAILKISRIIVPIHYPLTTNHYPLTSIHYSPPSRFVPLILILRPRYGQRPAIGG